jgi:hypothetical protein
LKLDAGSVWLGKLCSGARVWLVFVKSRSLVQAIYMGFWFHVLRNKVSKGLFIPAYRLYNLDYS